MDRTGSVSCAIAGFDISGVESSFPTPWLVCSLKWILHFNLCEIATCYFERRLRCSRGRGGDNGERNVCGVFVGRSRTQCERERARLQDIFTISQIGTAYEV